MRCSRKYFALLAVLWMQSGVLAQGLLVDVHDRTFRLPRPAVRPEPHPLPRTSYQVTRLAIDAAIQDQVARVQVSQTFSNTGRRELEASFVFPLPYDGAVTSMTFMVDGKEYPAKLLDAKEAREIYEGYVRQNKDPALLEWLGSGMFQTSVFPVPAGQKRTVTLRYTQLCRQSGGLNEFLFPLSTAKYTSKPLEELSVRVTIQGSSPIKNLYSSSHDVKIQRKGERRAILSYQVQDHVPLADFRIFYDTAARQVGASVISYRPDSKNEGYFLLLVSPEMKKLDSPPVSKTVVFVLDRSGSMGGQKFEQAREALEFVLNNLREGDTFNIVAYDSKVESFRPELQRFDPEIREEAVGFVEGLHTGGSTNIDGALQTTLKLLNDEQRPTYVIFLTDGLPTVGETMEARIVANAMSANSARARIFSFGVGYDVNSRLLDKLSRTGFGFSQYVRPDENIEASVSRLFRRIESPVLTNVTLSVELDSDQSRGQASLVNRVYPRGEMDLFAEEQLVVVGRYRQGGQVQVTVRGSIADQKRVFHFPVELKQESTDDSHAFVAKLWATRRVGEIIDEIDLNGKNQELVDELVRLATRHGIVTPYTSFLADDSPVALAQNRADRLNTVSRDLERLQEPTGKAGFDQRRSKGKFLDAVRAPSSGFAFYSQPDDDQRVAARNVRYIAGKTFYRRGKMWVESELDETGRQQAISVERFGEQYFELIRKYGPRLAKYLAIDEPITVVIDSQAYAF